MCGGLGYAYQSGIPVVDSDALGPEGGPQLRVRHHPCTRFPAGTPCHNPYGIGRLEPVLEDK